jgi:hypothetical protein
MSVAVVPVVVGNVGDRGPRGIGHLASLPTLMIKQTRRGCIQELFGCEAKNEFNIATIEQPNVNFMYSLEESSCCCRFICKNRRSMQQHVWMGNNAGGGDAFKVMSAKKDFTCGLAPCQCCCNPYLDLLDGANAPLGKIKVPMFCNIPQYNIYDENGQQEYEMHQPTCCGGLCVDLNAEGFCNCKIPYYIYTPGQADKGKGMEKGVCIPYFLSVISAYIDNIQFTQYDG